VDTSSHGNQQRVQLVGDPGLLVFDEPFAGLDPIAIGAMSDLLCELAGKGATVLFSPAISSTWSRTSAWAS
jgi:ABC-2 type transport system ATP-binding protein